jgi:hypothetical protein
LPHAAICESQSFLRNLLSTRRVDKDIDEEVQSHLEMLTDENIRNGMSPGEAQRAARSTLSPCNSSPP